MPKISRENAIKLLNGIIEEIEDLRQLDDSQSEFIRWKKQAESRVENIFGPAHSNFKEFHYIGYRAYILGATKQQEAAAYSQGLEKAKSQVLDMVNEIKNYWPDDREDLAEEIGEAETIKRRKGFNRLCLSMKLSFIGVNAAIEGVKKCALKYGLNPKKDILLVKTATKFDTQEVEIKIKECDCMLQIYDARDKKEPFTWLFFEYAIAKVMGKTIVRIVEERFLDSIVVDRDYHIIPFNKNSGEREAIERAIEEAFGLLFPNE